MEKKAQNIVTNSNPGDEIEISNETDMEANAKEHVTENSIPVLQNYKDTIFRMIFKDTRELLSLYNAVNGTHYDNPEELEVTTLENAIYMKAVSPRYKIGEKHEKRHFLYTGHVDEPIRTPVHRKPQHSTKGFILHRKAV